MTCLEPFFSLTPLNPYYDVGIQTTPLGSLPGVSAYFYAAGVSTGAVATLGPASLANLEDHYNNDRLLLYGDPVLETYEDINGIEDDIYRKCAIRMEFTGFNIGTGRQYLLVFRLQPYSGSPVAQFFIGTDFIQSVTITRLPYDDIAILLDAIDGDQFNITVRLAAPNIASPPAAPENSPYHGFYFMGVNCYLL